MTPKYKYIYKILGYCFTCYLIASLLVACGGSAIKEENDKDFIFTRAQIENLDKDNYTNLRTVSIKNNATSNFAKQILKAFPAENWKDKSFKTLTTKVLKELLQTEMTVPFLLNVDGHIISIKEMYQQEDDWQEERAVATFAVFSHNNKDAYVFVAEGLMKRNEEHQINQSYQHFWYFNGRKWRSITNEIKMPNIKYLTDLEKLAIFINNKRNTPFVLVPSVLHKEKIACHLSETLVLKLKLDKSFNLRWIGDGFQLEEEPEFVISTH